MIRKEGLSIKQAGGDRRDYYKWIKSTFEEFFDAYYNGDRLKLYSFFDTDFQIEVPLNIFIYHPKYNHIDLGEFLDIGKINLSKLKDKAIVTIKIKRGYEISLIDLSLRKEFGNWKIEGENFF